MNRHGINSTMRTAALLCAAIPAFAEKPVPMMMRGLEVDEKVGRAVDLNLEFVNEANQIVPLSSYFHKGRPVMLNLIQYRCPMLCNLVLNGQTTTMRELQWTPGNEYDIVTLTIDPEETAHENDARFETHSHRLARVRAVCFTRARRRRSRQFDQRCIACLDQRVDGDSRHAV